MLINVLSVEKNLPKGVAKGVNLTSIFRVYSQEKKIMSDAIITQSDMT